MPKPSRCSSTNFKSLQRFNTLGIYYKVGVRAALKKVDLHLDYLTGRNVIFALTSNDVEDDEKAEMANKLMTFEKVDVALGKPYLPKLYDDSRLHDFVNEESWHFFDVFALESNF